MQMDAKIWNDILVLGVPVLEKIVRPIVVYVFLIVGLRLAGKRELAQLNPFDLVVLLTLSNTVQNAIIGDDNSITGGLIGAATLLLVNYVVVRFLYGHLQVDRLVEGASEVLIDHGRVIQANLKRELITLPELETAAHKQGFDSLDEVEHAQLEPGGTVSFIRREPPLETPYQKQVLERLDSLSQELAALRARLPSPGMPSQASR